MNVQKLEDMLSENAIKLLRTFSDIANKGVALHAFDQRRWEVFIVAAHKEHSRLDGAMLHRWLHEEGRWTDEIASQRGAEYDFARSLLEFYDNPDSAA